MIRSWSGAILYLVAVATITIVAFAVNPGAHPAVLMGFVPGFSFACSLFIVARLTREAREKRERVILEVLREGPAYGVEITRRADARGTPLSNGLLYTTLRAMEERGLLTSHEEPRPGYTDGRTRRVYTIAEKP